MMTAIEYVDVLVVGAGLAGLTVARNVEGKRVLVVHPGVLGGDCASAMARGGIAVVLGEDDAEDLHVRDTLKAGVGMSQRERVECLVHEGVERVIELFEMGIAFDRSEDGELHLGLEAAHSRNRIVHAGGDRTGAVVMQGLIARIQELHGNVEFRQGEVVELIVDQARVYGAVVVGEGGVFYAVLAGSVVLASGGAGQLFRYSTNPAGAVGSGLGLAYVAGARLADMEFVQFHPTALRVESVSLPLLSEAIRGEGGVVVDEKNRRFLIDHHPLAELAPRDVVARAIWLHRQAGHEVFLDVSPIGKKFFTRFPSACEALAAYGVDIYEGIPITPAAHYHMGGVQTDGHGRTSLEGLWAVGEVASSGVHGANRLASNSLLEAMVFGARVGRGVEDVRVEAGLYGAQRGRAARLVENWRGAGGGEEQPELLAEIQRVMWDGVGIARNSGGLVEALGWFDERLSGLGGLVSRQRTLLVTGRLIAEAALARRESLGAHYREDSALVETAFV